MTENDRTPTMAIVEMPAKPLVDRRMRYFVLQLQAYEKCGDRVGLVFVVSIFAALGAMASAWWAVKEVSAPAWTMSACFAIAYVAAMVVGYFWARQPIRAFEKRVKEGSLS